MYRWLAYFGSPVLLEELLYKPRSSLVVQSLHSRLGAETTNGDGFGMGWYGTGDSPGVFAAPSRHGTTATCATSRPTSPRRGYLPIFARPADHQSSRRTATRFVTAAGCG